MIKKWMVVYTKPQHEKKATNRLMQSEIEVFLPLQKVLRQWSDRKKWIEAPLFPGYLFVNITEKDYLNVLNCPGIVKFIRHGGVPACVDNKVIKGIKESLNKSDATSIETTETLFNIGQEIDIKNGPFRGLKGKLVSFKGKRKIAIEIECMNRRILIESESTFLN